MSKLLIKWEKGGLKNPLARARGLGSAHDGLHHWRAQRLTSVASIPLSLWFLWVVVALRGADHATVLAWMAQPVNAILMILTVVTFFYHAWLGMQVVIEDYVHNEGFKMVKLATTKMALFALAVAAIFSILKIAL